MTDDTNEQDGDVLEMLAGVEAPRATQERLAEKLGMGIDDVRGILIQEAIEKQEERKREVETELEQVQLEMERLEAKESVLKKQLSDIEENQSILEANR